MSLLSESAHSVPIEVAAPTTNHVRPATPSFQEHLASVLAAAQPRARIAERRRETRHPYPYPVYLTPVGRDGTPTAQSIVVLGKHLSEHGFDFYFRDPLPYRRVVVSFEAPRGTWIGMLLDLTWCRFGRHGWYDNGGRFIGMVPSPLAEESLPSLMD